MYTNYKIPLKGVKIIAVITAVLCCLTALGIGAFAVSSMQTIELNAEDNEAELIMNFPQAAAEKISSMQISLTVSSISRGADIEFVSESGLPAKIVESRYHSDTGVLTVYLAGTEPLFSDEPLTLGKITINGSNVSASVNVKEGSIKFVRGSELVSPSGDIVYPSSVKISTGGSVEPEPPYSSSSSSSDSSYIPPLPDSSHTTSSSSITSSSSSSGTSSHSSSSSSSTSSHSTSSSSSTSSYSASSSSVSSEPKEEPVEKADTSSLVNAIDRAGEYKRADYTAESYGVLVSSLNKAKEVMANSWSSQDEVDEALLILENAIGMLVSVNNAPSGTDDYSQNASSSPESTDNTSNGNVSSPSESSEKPSESSTSEKNDQSSDNSQSSESNGSSEKNDQSSNGQTVDSEQNSSESITHSTSSSDTSAKNSGSSAVMWIIIVMAVLAVTAGVLIAVLKLKKK